MKDLINQSVHKVLAHSYLAYFLLCSFGLFLGLFFPIRFSVPHADLFAVICFGVGPLLILWAQMSSHKFEVVKQDIGAIRFTRGPYRYLRNPTQLGLVILVLGYAFVSQSAMLFVTIGVSYLISNIFFKKHESILEHRYGERYTQYKAKTPKIL